MCFNRKIVVGMGRFYHNFASLHPSASTPSCMALRERRIFAPELPRPFPWGNGPAGPQGWKGTYLLWRVCAGVADGNRGLAVMRRFLFEKDEGSMTSWWAPGSSCCPTFVGEYDHRLQRWARAASTRCSQLAENRTSFLTSVFPAALPVLEIRMRPFHPVFYTATLSERFSSLGLPRLDLVESEHP